MSSDKRLPECYGLSSFITTSSKIGCKAIQRVRHLNVILPELSASRRAQLINRRIASVLAREESLGPVIVQTNPQRNVATLQLNNRVLMTVTQQDSQDFGLDVEVLAQRWAEELTVGIDCRH